MLKPCNYLAALALLFVPFLAQADIRISNDWPLNHLNDLDEKQLAHERALDKAMSDEADAMCAARNASTDKTVGQPHYDQYFMLYVDGAKYYMQGAMFMSKTRPNERCTPVDKDLVYLCEQGQRFKESAHLLFMDSNFQDAGVYKIKINTPYDVFVNAMLALGIANKTRNELLLTVQYFAIDGKGAHTISEVGDGWKRMTVLLRLKAVDGKIEVEQDDSCLDNPNNYETIPDARKALVQCVAKKHAGQ